MSPAEQLRAEVGPLLLAPCLLRDENGVQVFRARYAGQPAFLKRFDRIEFRREIDMYRLLQRLNVPTVPVLALGNTWLALSDLTVHPNWRLATEADAADPALARALAAWYARLHEAALNRPELEGLYRESDRLTAANLARLICRFPQGRPTFEWALEHLDDLRERISAQESTLNYNDFFWTNMAVRRDGSAALMLDYNFMGAGPRMSDLHNVTCSLSAEAGVAFNDEYRRLYRNRHGADWDSAPQETLLAAIEPLITLLLAIERSEFPAWAHSSLAAAGDGSLLILLRRALAGNTR